LTTSVPAIRRCHGRPEWVQQITPTPLAATRSRCSSSGSDCHQKSFSASGEPCTRCTAQPPMCSRRWVGSRPIQAAKARLVWVSV